MQAEFIMLTHFSQRYAKIPVFGKQFSDNVGVAFDNMTVSPGQLKSLPHLIRPLMLMFAKEYEEMELKGLRRMAREEEKNKVASK